jgi:hypothetical protein
MLAVAVAVAAVVGGVARARDLNRPSYSRPLLLLMLLPLPDIVYYLGTLFWLSPWRMKPFVDSIFWLWESETEMFM